MKIRNSLKKVLRTRSWKEYQRYAYNRYKAIAHSLSPPIDSPQTAVFIVGCQRSGTTMLLHIFFDEYNTKVFREKSAITSDDQQTHIRLNAPDKLRQEFARHNCPLIITKPLVESQNTPELLDAFPGSRAIWVYRDYKKVATSNLRKWGRENGINNLRPIMERDPTNWRAEKVPDETYRLVSRHFREDMNPYDAAALFWYIRNNFYFQNGLHLDERVYLCKYENLVLQPKEEVWNIYRFIGQPFPGDHFTNNIFQTSLKRRADIDISPEIQVLCEGMMERLDQELEKKKLARPLAQASK